MDQDPETNLSEWASGHGVQIVDYRDLATWPRDKVYPREYGYPRNKVRGQPPHPEAHRPWTQITTLVLHTTAVAGMTGKRGLGIPAHLYLPREPAVVLCHALELRLPHAHAANAYSVGLEISGLSAWDSPDQRDRARALLVYFQAVRRAHVGPDATCYVAAHRQSHWSRGNDPGREIWVEAGQWAIDELGYQLGPVVGSGRDVSIWA